MKAFAIWLLTLLVLHTSLAAQGIRYVEIDTPTQTEVQMLWDTGIDSCDVDDFAIPVTRGFITTDQRIALESAGLTVRDLPMVNLNQVTDEFITLAQYEADMQAWASAHPDYVSLTSLGQTHEGRDIWMLKVSDNVASDEDEPETLMISLQHAREWLAGMTLHGIVDHIISEYGNDPEITDLVNTLELHFVLVANPDGYSYTHTDERLWRKNRRDNGDGTFGVDTNRNWEWQWNTASSSTGSNTYRGPAPLSEPETQALANWVTAPGRNLIGMLNYHTYGTRVMHNWAYTYDLPPNADVMGPLVRHIAEEIESVNGQPMRNGSWAITLAYVGGGSTIDHFQAIFGVPAITFELRPGDGASGGFVPPASSIVPSQTENIPGAIAFLQWVRTHATDPTAPVISDLSVSRLSNTQMTVTWNTDEPATRRVEYGLTASPEFVMAPDSLRGMAQSVTLTGLTPSTTYHLRVASENNAGLTTTSDFLTTMTTATAQDITPPSAPAIDHIRTTPAGNLDFSWLVIEGGSLAGHRLHRSVDGENWETFLDENTLTSGMTSHTVPVSTEQFFWYRLTNVDLAGNESESSDVYGSGFFADTSSVLVVDGYDRWASKPIAQDLNHPFAAWHGEAIGAQGLTVDTVRNELVDVNLNLSDYELVVWVLGDESTQRSTFDAGEQDTVEAYLQGGGNFFVSGSEIGLDLDSQGSAGDKDFYANFLCADFQASDADEYVVQGADANAFTQGTYRFDEGSRGIYRVNLPNRIVPVNGSTTAVKTMLNRTLGVQATQVFPGGSAVGRLIYLSFPFETVHPREDRLQLMSDAMEYFAVTGPVPVTGVTTH